jgi:hypothetical protein
VELRCREEKWNFASALNPRRDKEGVHVEWQNVGRRGRNRAGGNPPVAARSDSGARARALVHVGRISTGLVLG